MAAVEHDPAVVRDSAVFEWRFEELERAGYSTQDAFLLAAARDVDLHEALRLLEQGCPPATAARILV